jgi:4-amino-4-deoxy-L-arabinose transferase-like glycosyltransferase
MLFTSPLSPATSLSPAPLPVPLLTPRQQLAGLLLLAAVVQLLVLGGYPLTDTTEARYSEIARKMLETGQWLVPQIDYGVPFWGKPPLSFWLTALSFKLLGVSEFAARLPSLLASAGSCALVYRLAYQQRGHEYALRAVLVAATSLLMLVCAGGVMTDPVLVLGTTLCMTAFWIAAATQSRVWGWLFFVGLAIGLLAKGPVGTLLTLLPIAAWTLLGGHWRTVWRALPWPRGSLLTLALTLPWYLAAENQSPGFLRYFFIGEHWQRFLVSGWQGDLYGSGHATARGTIWLYGLLGTLPWSGWMLWHYARRGGSGLIAELRAGQGRLLYALCWMLAPLLLFTMARNILPTYVLPGLAGFSLLAAQAWETRERDFPATRVRHLAWIAPVAALLVVLAAAPRLPLPTQKGVVSAYRDALQASTPLLYYRSRPYSAQFYSAGAARETAEAEGLARYLDEFRNGFVAARPDDIAQLPAGLRLRLEAVAAPGADGYQLLRQRAPATAGTLAVAGRGADQAAVPDAPLSLPAAH